MNESGAKLAWPELSRLRVDCHPGDVLMIEQVDGPSRLIELDWRQLREALEAQQAHIAALSLSTSWSVAVPFDEFSSRRFAAVHARMLDVLAAVAPKDYE